MDQEGATQSTAITAPSSNSRLTSSSSSSGNVRNENIVGEEEGGEKGGQQLNRVVDQNQENGVRVRSPVASPSRKRSKHGHGTKSVGLSLQGSPFREKGSNKSNNSYKSSYTLLSSPPQSSYFNNTNRPTTLSNNSYNNLLSSPPESSYFNKGAVESSAVASQVLSNVTASALSSNNDVNNSNALLPPPNNVGRSTTLSSTSSSNGSSRGVGAAEFSTAAATSQPSIAANALSSNNNVHNSNAITSSNTNNGSEVGEVCIMDKSCTEEGWGPGIKQPQKVDMMAVMEKAMKEITLDRARSNGAPPALQPIGESSDKVVSININKTRKEVLSLLCSGVEYSASVATTGSDQPTKQLIQSLDQPTTQEQMKNNLIVGEKFIFGTWSTATFVLIINPDTGNVVKKLSSMQFKSGNGKEYNDPDKCVEVVIGGHDIPSHPDEVPKEWLQQRKGGSYNVRITIDYLKWIQSNPDARLRHTLQCRVVTREVFVTTPEVDAAREAEFVELVGIAQVFFDKRNPNKSSGMVEVRNAVECDDDYDGQTFQAGEITYRQGDNLLHTYDSVSEYIGHNSPIL